MEKGTSESLKDLESSLKERSSDIFVLDFKNNLTESYNHNLYISEELIKVPCTCGRSFFINSDYLGIEKLCHDCKKSKILLQKQ